MKVSPWISGENCSFRTRIGGRIDFIPDRVAFIEKTPRVRIRPAYSTDQIDHRLGEQPGSQDFLNWCEGYKGGGPDDPASKDWCDRMLILMGYEL